jgi:CheY-like chemotaxis protein
MNNKILIVDDDSDSLILQQTILQRLGYYTQLAVNGLDAMKIIMEDKPDIILLDIFMPQMDGFETISILQKKHPEIPVIIVTAGGAKIINKLKEMGIHYHIQKPISPTKLQKEIAKCVKVNFKT